MGLCRIENGYVIAYFDNLYSDCHFYDLWKSCTTDFAYCGSFHLDAGLADRIPRSLLGLMAVVEIEGKGQYNRTHCNKLLFASS